MTLLELFELLKKHMKLVVGLPVVCALLVAAYSFIGMPNTYTATTSLYVLTSQDQSSSNLSSDLFGLPDGGKRRHHAFGVQPRPERDR